MHHKPGQESRQEFIAAIAYDLKNSLSGTNQILEILAERQARKSPPDESALLLMVRDSNKALLTILQGLIDAYRDQLDCQTIGVESADIQQVLCGSIAEVAPIADHRQIKIHTQLTPDLKQIM